MRHLLLLLIGIVYAAPALSEKIPVTVQPLDQLWQDYVFDAPADVISLNRSSVSAEITTTIDTINVRVGDRVQQGDSLLKLDCETYKIQREIHQATLSKAKSQLPYARDQLQRALDLRKKKSISNEMVDMRKTELDAAKADLVLSEQRLSLAERDIANCDVKAPFSGVVLARKVSVGDYVTAGTALIELLDSRNLEVKANLRSDELTSLKTATQVWLVSDGENFPLSLRASVNFIDRQSLTVETRLLFSGDTTAVPGSTGRLHWRNQQKYLSADYLIRREQGLGLFVLNNQQAEFIAMQEAIEGQPFKINLPADTLLIIEGRQRLKPGDNVLIVEPN